MRALVLALFFSLSNGFVVKNNANNPGKRRCIQNVNGPSSHGVVPNLPRSNHALFAGADGEEVAAPLVSGEELELLLNGDWEQPIVIDAYATWCGPCLLMSPEFEAAAQQLQGKVRLVKLDCDKDEQMAARLNIMGLPTLLFLDKYSPEEGEDNQAAKAVLKGRIEGALQKQMIIDLCEHYFFGGEAPQF